MFAAMTAWAITVSFSDDRSTFLFYLALQAPLWNAAVRV